MKHASSPPVLAATLSSLPLDFEPALRQAAALGFRHVEVTALAERPQQHLDALADSGLLVSSAAVGRALPDGCTLDARSTAVRREALELMKRQVSDAARLGATLAYLVPGTDAGDEGLACFAEACSLLADHAGQRQVRLCVEHFPGRALAGAGQTLAWLDRLRHDNLFLLLDVGHCLISREDPAAIIRQAGRRLGHVHLDDNDGQADLHWPLLAGRLTEGDLTSVLAALGSEDYRGAIVLELNPRNDHPQTALAEGRALVERLLGATWQPPSPQS
jgi:D-psicose/D-tagatose/L-ribulose 3-epimerase